MPDSLLQTSVTAPTGLRTRWRDRRRLRRLDRLGARLAHLDAVDALLSRAHDRIASGWVQDAWFTTIDEEGVRLHVGTLHAHDGEASEQSCLVAAIAVEALPGTLTGSVGQRAIGTMWNVLHGGGATGEWAAPPGVTAARAYDLVRWNDATDRRQSDVLALVDASRSSIGRSAGSIRAELASA